MLENDYSFDTNYRKGYFKALLDTNNFFEEYSQTIKDFRLNNINGLKKILKALLDGREYMMKYGYHVDFTIVCDKNNIRDVKNLYVGPAPVQKH